MKSIRIAVLAAFLAAAAALPASAQPVGYPLAPPPPPVTQPPPQTCLTSNVCAPPSAAPSAAAPTYPPAYYNPYGYPGYQGVVGGTLNGYANLVNSTGQFQIQNQQSRMLQTQADSARIGLRQQQIEEQRWEQSLLPTTLERRQADEWRKLQTARNNPSDPEIWSGESLNALLTALKGAEVQGLAAEPVPIPTDVMQHINFTTGTQSGAGAAMLKEFNSIQWPFCLQSPPFLDGSTQIDGLAKKAVEEIQTAGRVTPATFTSLNTAVNALNDAANANQTLSPTDWIEATTFTGALLSSVQSLRNPNVAQYFNGQLAPQAGTVPDLVQQMTTKGLRFAPAAPGDQPAYTTMQTLLRTYDYRLATLVSH